MPELPEVETMCRGIRGIVGQRIESLVKPKCECRPIVVEPEFPVLQRKLKGKTVSAVRRLGKRVVLVIEDEFHVVFEPRMTGLVLLADPPDHDHLRAEIRFESGSPIQRLWFWDRRGLGRLSGLTTAELNGRRGPEVLGPDALDVDELQFKQRFDRSRRPIKVALLDQAKIAGIGNLYASEMLHLSKIHPETACAELTTPQWRRLHSAMRQVLETAIHYEGSTLGDGTYRNALNASGGYQNHHRVYDRADETCPGCKRNKIVRIVQAQRSTFFCPVCQRSAK